MTHIDGYRYGTSGADYLKINHTAQYNPGSSWSDYQLEGYEGSDILIGGHGDDDLYGGSGNDTLAGGYGVNLLNGGSGIDTADYAAFGTNTSYVSSYGVYANLATGIAYARAAGQDLDDTLVSIENLNGSGKADRLYGNSIDNVLKGNGGNDAIYGGSGDDDIYGGSGNDFLNGQAGDDYISASTGNDEIWGGSGADYLIGGTGYDVFNFTNISDSTVSSTGRDTIADFQEDIDLIDLSAMNAFDFIGRDGFNGLAGEVRYYFSSGNTIVQADTNGNGLADFAMTVKGTHYLIEADFVF
jgi:Ca2+-binding RTX toxin-like protein